MFFQSDIFKKTARYFSLLFVIMLISFSLKAESPPPPSSISNPFVMIMLVIIIILALAIGLLANVVMGAAFVQREHEIESEQKSTSTGATIVSVVGLMMLISVPGMAQDKPTSAAVASNLMDGISPTAFYLIAGVIFVELIVILALLYNLRLILNIERRKKELAQSAAALPAKPKVNWWDNFNKFKPISEEVDIDLGHNYDGIRELDNRLPPWWLYGFYLTILFACIYLWRFHVSHTAPLSGEEFQIAMQDAAIQKEAYLKKAANNIDETNVKFRSNAGDLAQGKDIFITICAACHGKDGQGVVGPNLTDDYWLHGNSISDIFKTIKYGYPEKGMKSWKDDYSPAQIADLASYIQTLRGTNPENPKAPQGNLITVQAGQTTAVLDSGSKATDIPGGAKNKDSTNRMAP